RLTVAGWRGDQGELAVEPSLEAGEQRGAGHQIGRYARRQEFGTEGVGRGLQARGNKHWSPPRGRATHSSPSASTRVEVPTFRFLSKTTLLRPSSHHMRKMQYLYA